MGHYECKKCGQHYDYCDCRKARAGATNTTSAIALAPRLRQRHELRRPAALEDKPTPSARGSVTVRRPDGTTITCTIDQLQDVLEQVHKVRPRPIEDSEVDWSYGKTR